MRLLVVLVLCLVMSVPSCVKRTVSLDRETRNTIDTVAAREIRELRPVLDSLCELQFETLVSQAVDSIFEQRRSEVQKILEQ